MTRPMRAWRIGMAGLAAARDPASPISDIHLGPGQERHLPHEAWHVVQQKQGRVAATAQLKGAAVNDSPALEAEADAMGARALAAGAGAAPDSAPGAAPIPQGAAPFQFRLLTFRPEGGNYQGGAALLHAMGQALEKQTMAAYTFVADELTGYIKGTAKFSFERYGCSSKERSNHYFNCLTKGSDAQKAAAAGYMIEDIVTVTFGNKTGYTSQYAVKGARPDFLIEAVDARTGKKARGVVDITTEKEAGHILDKDFTISSYDYAAECLYPILDFKTGAKVVLDPASAPTARQVQIGRANAFVASLLNKVWMNADMYDNAFNSTFRKEVVAVKAGVRSVWAKSDVLAKDLKTLDDNILQLNDKLFAPLDTVGKIIGVAQQKYGLAGYPRSWAVPQQTQAPTSVTSVLSTPQQSATSLTAPIVNTTSSSAAPAPTSARVVTTSSTPQPVVPSAFSAFSATAPQPSPALTVTPQASTNPAPTSASQTQVVTTTKTSDVMDTRS